MDSQRYRQKRFRGQAAVTATVCIFGLTYSLTASLIALILAARGTSDTLIGLNACMHAVGVLLIAPFLPGLAARFGGQRLILGSLLLTAIVLMLFPIIPWIWVWFPLRILLGLAAECLFVISEMWTNDLSDETSRGRSMAIYTAAMSLGFAGGPLILSLSGTSGVLPYAIGAGCALVAMGIVGWPGIPVPIIDKPHSIDSRRYLRLAPVALASTALNAGIETAGLSFLPLYAMSAGWGEENATRLVATLMIGAIVLQLPIGWLADKVERRKLMIWLALIAGVSALIWPLVMQPRWLAYSVLFVWGGLFVGIYTIMLTVVGSRFRGSDLVGIYAAMGVTWGVGALLGPMLVGVAMTFTVQGLPLVAAASCLAYALFARLTRQQA
jgi:MFS family permease